MHPRAFESHGDSAPLASPAEALPSATEPQQLPLLFLSRPRPPTLCPPPGHPRDSQVSSLSVHDWDLPVTQSDGQALHRQPPLTCLWMLVDVCDSGRDSPTVCPRHPEERRRGLLRGRRQPHRPLPAPLPPWSPASETSPLHGGREPQAPPGRPPPPGRRTCGRAARRWVGGKRPPPSRCPSGCGRTARQRAALPAGPGAGAHGSPGHRATQLTRDEPGSISENPRCLSHIS